MSSAAPPAVTEAEAREAACAAREKACAAREAACAAREAAAAAAGVVLLVLCVDAQQ
jgi:hypothetical protein